MCGELFFNFSGEKKKISSIPRLVVSFRMICSIWNVVLPPKHFLVSNCAEMCEDNFFNVEFNTCEILRQRRRLNSKCKTGRFCLDGANGKKNKTNFTQYEAHKIQQESLRVIIFKNFYKLEKNIWKPLNSSWIFWIDMLVWDIIHTKFEPRELAVKNRTCFSIHQLVK